ncbi:hypothetical protein CRE_06814 [Caenorhabditis remanei]|uniref:F-box domain-containing protein n=1 Tax=Caenorhabditis remanei TaxID=31234 RepID=E3MNY1_CAERE|nr:hypothetical protein CRE_06814 [Caenorhabditis remanei]
MTGAKTSDLVSHGDSPYLLISFKTFIRSVRLCTNSVILICLEYSIGLTKTKETMGACVSYPPQLEDAHSVSSYEIYRPVVLSNTIAIRTPPPNIRSVTFPKPVNNTFDLFSLPPSALTRVLGYLDSEDFLNISILSRNALSSVMEARGQGTCLGRHVNMDSSYSSHSASEFSDEPSAFSYESLTLSDESTVTLDENELQFKPFRLFALPQPALRLVFLRTALADILEISQLSKKSRLAIKSCSIPVSHLDFSWNDIMMIRNFQTYERCELKFRTLSYRKFNKIHCGVMFTEWERNESTIICAPYHNQGRIRMVNYLIDLFNVHRLNYKVNNWPEIVINKMLFMLPKHPDNMIIKNDNNEAEVEETIEKVLEHIVVKDAVYLWCKITRVTENMIKVKRLILDGKTLPISELLKLDCQILQVNYHEYTAVDVRKLILNWKQNKTEIEQLKINYQNHDFDLFQIMEEIETKPSGVADYFGIERDCDGLEAVIGYEEKHVVLRVRSYYKIRESPREIEFPLFSLPFQALKNVFQQMNPAETLEISLLSNKSKANIRQCAVRIKRIVLTDYRIILTNNCNIYTLFDLIFDNDKHKSCTSRIIGNSQFKSWVKTVMHFKQKIFCTPSNPADTFEAFKHFVEIYKFDEIKYIVSEPMRSFMKNSMHLLPKTLTALSFPCTKSAVEPRDFEDNIDTVLKYFKQIDDLEIGVSVTKLPEKAFSIGRIFLIFSQNLSFDVLMKLNCSSITIGYHELTNDHVRTWIRHWKENDTNIKTLSIQKRDYFNLDNILEGFEKKSWNTYGEEEKKEYLHWSDGDLLEIQRDSDEIKASVGHLIRYLQLNVWEQETRVSKNRAGLSVTQAAVSILEESTPEDDSNSNESTLFLGAKPNGFRLLALPETVFKTVLNQMEFCEILELSFSSEKSKSLIQNCSIQLEYLDFCWDKIIVCSDRKSYYPIQFKELTSLNSTKVRKIKGSKFIEWNTTGSNIHCTPLSDENRCIMMHYLNELFKVKQLKYTVNKWPTFVINKLLYKLPKRAHSLQIYQLDRHVAEETKKSVLGYFDVDDITVQSSLPCLPTNIHNVKRLKVGSCQGIPMEEMHSLNCESLEISKHSYTNDDIRQLILNWKDNKTRLEYFQLGFDNINLYEVLEGIDTKPSGYKDYFGVERDCDGLMAAIGYTENTGAYGTTCGRVEFILKNNCPEEKPMEKVKFPLFSLPFLALREVFKEMNPAEALEISLLSKKSKASISNCAVKIRRIVLYEHRILLTNGCDVYTLFQMVFSYSTHKSCRTQTIGNSRFIFWTNAHKQFKRIIYCTQTHPNDIFVAFNHFLDIYKFEDIKCSLWSPIDKYIENSMHLLPKNANWIDMYAESSDETRTLENCVDRVLDYFESINIMEVRAPVTRLTERMLNISTIILMNCQELPFNVLLKLNCSDITLWNHRLTNDQLRTWIKQWMKNKTKFKSLNIQPKDYDLKYILRGFNIESCRTRTNINQKDFYYNNFYDSWEFRRESDGKKASLGYKYIYLHLQEWDD